MLQRHDFRQRERPSSGRTAALLPLLATAARLVANAMTAWLETPTTCKAENVNETSYRQLLEVSDERDIVVVFTCAEHLPEGLLAVPRRLLDGLIGKLMGGPVTPADEHAAFRRLTDFDRAMAMKMAGKMVDGLDMALEQRLTIDGTMLRAECDLPRLPRTQAPDERYLSLPLRMEVSGDDAAPLVGGVFRIAVPTSFLQALIEEKATPAPRDPALNLERCERIAVDVRAEFGHRDIALQQLLGLRPGSTIALAPAAARTVLVRVEGAPKFVGRAARHGDRVVVEIERSFKEDDHDAELPARI